MALLIGIDEAGYGPNLGPLVVGGTLWQVPDVTSDLYQLLYPVFCSPGQSPPETNGNNGSSLAVGDSKRLYSSGGSLAKLELPVLALLATLGTRVSQAVELFQCLANIEPDDLCARPGYDWSGLSLPIDTDAAGLQRWAGLIRGQLAAGQVHFHRMAVTVMFPEDWNQGLQEFGNKASLLSIQSCRLVRELLRSLPDSEPHEPVHIFCDKHGGRNRYAAIIQQEITSHFVTVRGESREASRYAWSDDNGRRLEIEFSARGERRMPVALASMIAKFFRELSMTAWNRFWQGHLPDLQPTAGYPLDARRFRRDIADVQRSLKINPAAIWRAR